MKIKNLDNPRQGKILNIDGEDYEIIQVDECQDSYEETIDYTIVVQKDNEYFVFDCTYDYYHHKWEYVSEELSQVILRPRITFDYTYIDEVDCENNEFKETRIVVSSEYGLGRIVNPNNKILVKFNNNIVKEYDTNGKEKDTNIFPSIFVVNDNYN